MTLSLQQSLSPLCYTSDAFYAQELEHIFRREWLCIGRALDIAEPGDYLTLDVAGFQIMAVRQLNGEVAAMSRVCRHRGALLGEDAGGNAKLFVCPYHRWVYELDGTLRGAPAMKGNPFFDALKCSLPQYRVEQWQGFVFVSTDLAAAPLGLRLKDIDERIENYRLDDLKSGFSLCESWNANWKVAVENGSESYHHIGVHSSTLEPFYPALGTICEEGSDAHNLHIVPRARDASGSLEEHLILNSELTEEQRSQFLIIGIYPSLVLVFAGEMVSWFTFMPEKLNRTTVCVGWLVPPPYLETSDAKTSLARDRAILTAILNEDRISCAAVQRGLASPDAASGPLSPLERTIAGFARYITERIPGLA